MHHKKVGSNADPITAPKNQTFYSYYVNAIKSAYKFNYQYNKTTFYMIVSSVILYNALLFTLAIKEGSGLDKACMFSLFSYASLVLMEAIEYVEHYGLRYRDESDDSQPTEMCSWNTTENPYLTCNIFRFQRHTDHHMNAYKMFPTMELTQKMLKFPFDFGNAMVIATIPQLWESIANPLVDAALTGKQPSKEHLQYVSKVVLCQRLLFIFLFLYAFVKFVMSG